jgi:hypothetical protein
VAGIRQRTGTLLAAHALIASFLGGTTIRVEGLEALSWLVPGSLVGWLAAAGFGYQALRSRNERRVRRMSACSGLLAVLMIVQVIWSSRADLARWGRVYVRSDAGAR